MIQGRKVLITGGGGFIATSLAERLAEHNEVTLFDKDFEHNAWSYARLQGHPHIRTVIGNILDREQVAHIVKSAQIVIHTAAMVGVHGVLHNTLHTLEVNYLGTSNLLETLINASKCELVVCFSTSEIFGPRAYMVDENADVHLPTPQDPRWSYCISKLAAEHLLLAYSREKGLPGIIIRPFNIFGPKRTGDHVLLRFIIKALKGDDLEVYGSGTQIRAWCYIDDLCEAVLQCLETKEAIGKTFNIGAPQNAITTYDLANKVIKLCGSSSRITFVPLDFQDVDIRIPDISRAKRILGFSPKVELEEGLVKTIAWARENSARLYATLFSNLQRPPHLLPSQGQEGA